MHLPFRESVTAQSRLQKLVTSDAALQVLLGTMRWWSGPCHHRMAHALRLPLGVPSSPATTPKGARVPTTPTPGAA